jgi:dihydrodipicolinate synthase/N-acetylneuraminate lyase
MTVLVRNATTFSKTGGIDEEAFRQSLQRFVDAKLGVYIASGGSGEGHALTRDEIRLLYRIGVEVCKGKVQVNSNFPEQHTARATREQVAIAVDAGVDVINIYGPSSLHGFRPTDAEFLGYYDNILPDVKHAVAIAPNPVIGYTPRPALIAEVCHKYHQVVAVNLSGQNDVYFIELKEKLKRDVEIYVPLGASVETLTLGGAGLVSAWANIIPKTHRRYLDLYEARKFDELAIVYADIYRFGQYTKKWHHSAPRWVKAAMKVLDLPGGQGGIREPYQMLAENELQGFSDGLLALKIPEITELARAAGLQVPA